MSPGRLGARDLDRQGTGRREAGQRAAHLRACIGKFQQRIVISDKTPIGTAIRLPA